MEIASITLEGQHVRLEPLSLAHREPLIDAASDGELWNSTVTVVPGRATMAAYIEAALYGQSLGKELPFVIIRKPSGTIVGTTRLYDIVTADRKAAVGYTRLPNAAQPTTVTTEHRLSRLTH